MHGIEGNSMMYVGEVPWHGLGYKFKSAPNIRQAIVAAKMNWTVELVPLMTTDGQKVEDAFVTRRSTDKSILGVVGARYKPLQNIEAFDFFQPFLDSESAQLHTAGVLHGGKRVWILAKINRKPIEIVPGDSIDKYVLLSNSHDGTLTVSAGFTVVRVVCANTLALAVKDKASKLIRVKHSKNVLDNLEAVRETMNLAEQQFQATAEQYRRLCKKTINRKDVIKYVKKLFDVEGDASTRRMNIIDDIVAKFETGKGNNLPAVKGTPWAAFNAVTEWLNYEAGRNQDSRLNSLWFGQNAQLNHRALELAMAI